MSLLGKIECILTQVVTKQCLKNDRRYEGDNKTPWAKYLNDKDALEKEPVSK